ncbi:MAG: hypothetical protein MUP63_01775 [Candidatus Nanohaloarchaeota archaeon QJJ-7]|nr:hypothetical protein [Candidatus Nanohaloarchaeota archaeon QJJ-7]
MKRVSLWTLVKLLVFVVVINTVLFTATGVLHEIGHLLMGVYYGCGDLSIVIFDLSSFATYTSMNCQTNPGGWAIVFSSFLLILPISLLFLSLRGFKEQYMGFILLGGNLLGSFTDVAALNASPVVRYTVFSVGILLVLIGEDGLVMEALREWSSEVHPLQMKEGDMDEDYEDGGVEGAEAGDEGGEEVEEPEGVEAEESKES